MVPLGSRVPAWALLPVFFPFFCFNTLPSFKSFEEQKLLPVDRVDLTFLVVLASQSMDLIVGTCK